MYPRPSSQRRTAGSSFEQQYAHEYEQEYAADVTSSIQDTQEYERFIQAGGNPVDLEHALREAEGMRPLPQVGGRLDVDPDQRSRDIPRDQFRHPGQFEPFIDPSANPSSPFTVAHADYTYGQDQEKTQEEDPMGATLSQRPVERTEMTNTYHPQVQLEDHPSYPAETAQPDTQADRRWDQGSDENEKLAEPQDAVETLIPAFNYSL